jgi:CHAT domain-containing protein/tetratricopeptide (TPR) repeat protein
VVAEQKGIDVVVRLFGPDGKLVVEVDSPNGLWGPEPVSTVAESAGEYKLEVRSLDGKAAPGRYEIKVEELREATAQDRLRATAERVYAEGEQLRGQGTAESLRKAIEKYGESLPLWRAVGDRQNEAGTLTRLGSIYWRLSDNPKALEYSNEALALWHSIGNNKEEAKLLNNIGVSYWQLGDSQKALEYYDRALPLRRVAGDRQGEAITLDAVGIAYSNLGRLKEAVEYHIKALALEHELGSRRDEAITLTNVGIIYARMGEFQKALEYFEQALPLLHAEGDRRTEGGTLSSIGVVYWQLGEYQRALDFYNQALPLRRAAGDRYGEFGTIANIGRAYVSAGEPQKALDNFNLALSIARDTKDKYGEGNTLQNMGVAYGSLGDQQKALDFLNQALRLQHSIGDRLGEAITLSHIGASYSSLGKPSEALSYLEQALTLHQAVGDRVNEALTLQNIARADRDLGRLSDARARTEAALSIVESTRSEFFSQQLRTSFLASKQGLYQFYIDLLMQMHRSQPAAGFDAAALQASERSRARSLLDILTEARADIRQGVNPALLERERSLQQRLSAKSEQLTRLQGGKHTEEQEEAVRKEVEALLADYQEAEAQIREDSPRYAALTQPQPLSLKQIQQTLDADTVLLEYALGEERSYLWAVTPTSIASFELPNRADVEAAARLSYESLTARNKAVRFESREDREARIARADAEYLTSSRSLSEMLLGPVAGQLKGKTLLVVSDGALQYVPFGVLPEPSAAKTVAVQKSATDKLASFEPLISSHEVVSLPSASTLATLRGESVGRPRPTKALAVFADPVFKETDGRVKSDRAQADDESAEGTGQSHGAGGIETVLARSSRDAGEVEFRRLPYSRREADDIVALTPKGTSKEWLDFDASRAAATGADLSNYRIVHFATHSLLDSRHPELSGIVLSLVDKEGRRQDGFLRLDEIYNLKLNADLVVLSACRTALGKEIKGEGLIGLARGFMYAGVPRVVTSFWAVDDETTADLMRRFYREMLVNKKRPAAALRAAQVGVWREKRLPPFYWAAFALQGEWK